MESSKVSYSNVNIAVVISLSSIALYAFGWVYWYFYFATLGVPFSLFELSINQVIFTTWPIIFLVSTFFIATVFQIFSKSDYEWDIITVSFILINVLLFFAFNLFKSYSILYVCLFIFIVFVIIRKVFTRNKIKDRFISVPKIRLIYLIVFGVLCPIYYGFSGRKDAHSILECTNSKCLITLKNNDIMEGVFIVGFNSKILIMSSDDCSNKKNIIVINENEISSLNFHLQKN